MKIIHVCLSQFYIDNYSYQENILPKMHKKQGHEVLILASTETYIDGMHLGYMEPSIYVNEYGIPVHRIPYSTIIPKKLVRKLRIYPSVYQEIKQFAPEIIFLHGIQFVSIKQVAKYAKYHPEVKIIADGHADFVNSARTFISYHLLHRLIYKTCAHLILPYVIKFYGTLPIRVEFFQKVYDIPAEKVDYMPLGVDDDMVEKHESAAEMIATKKKFGFSPNDFIIVTGGKIDFNKKQTLLLMEAVNEISSQNVKLLVFGSVAADLKEQFNALCSNKVKYAGWATVDESYEYFSIADLVIFPGTHSVYWEQAAGLGKPLVVRYWEGITHVDLGGNVLFLYDNSKSELICIINKLIENKNDFEEMKRCAIEKGKTFFSYRNIAARIIQ